MKRRIIEVRAFSKEVDFLIKKRSLLRNDFEDFKKSIVEDPEIGDVIVGTGGIRKIRLKSATKGKVVVLGCATINGDAE